MVTAAARLLDLPVGEVAMVGDSSTDVYSGNAAGAFTVYLAPDPANADPLLVEAADLVATTLTDVLTLVG